LRLLLLKIGVKADEEGDLAGVTPVLLAIETAWLAA
jgi:hypothetical protein